MRKHFWVRISARDLRGRLLEPSAHLLVYSTDARSAAHEEIVVETRDRIRQAVNHDDYELCTSVASVGMEGMVLSA